MFPVAVTSALTTTPTASGSATVPAPVTISSPIVHAVAEDCAV